MPFDASLLTVFEPEEDTPEIRVHARAKELLKEFGLWEQGWRFDISTTTNFVGDCDHRKKLIRVSVFYMHHDFAEIEDTLRHEIAHALVGPKHDHDDTWKNMARFCGATPKSCAADHVTTSAKPNYRIRCPECGWTVTRFRMKRRNFGSMCPKCGTVVKIFRIRRSS